jgi:hypothetical protein
VQHSPSPTVIVQHSPSPTVIVQHSPSPTVIVQHSPSPTVTVLVGGAAPTTCIRARCSGCCWVVLRLVLCSTLDVWSVVSGLAGITYASFKMLEFEEQPSMLGPGFLSHSKQKVLVLCCPSGEVSVVVAGILPCWLSQDG